MKIRKPHKPIVKFVSFEDDELASFVVNKIKEIREKTRKDAVNRVYVETQILPRDKQPAPWNILILSQTHFRMKQSALDEFKSLCWQDGHVAVASHQIHDEFILPKCAQSMPFVVLLRTLPGKQFRTSFPEAILSMYARYVQNGFEGAPWGAIVKPTRRKPLSDWIKLCSKTLESYPNAVKIRMNFGFEHEEYVFDRTFPTVNATENQCADSPLTRGSFANG